MKKIWEHAYLRKEKYIEGLFYIELKKKAMFGNFFWASYERYWYKSCWV